MSMHDCRELIQAEDRREKRCRKREKEKRIINKIKARLDQTTPTSRYESPENSKRQIAGPKMFLSATHNIHS
jgi:hypothetical protein